MIDSLVEDLKLDEGWRASAYQDHLGYWTIGYGFLIDESRRGELPRSVGEMWLTLAVSKRWNELVTRIPWVLDQPETVQRALGNMAYQLGVRGVLNFKRMIAALEDGDRELAVNEALDSTWAKQTPKRARRVVALLGANHGTRHAGRAD